MIEDQRTGKSLRRTRRAARTSTCRSGPASSSSCSGPSGAGKSTLLRCINRLAEPDGGEIVVDGTRFVPSGRDLRLLRRTSR